MDGAYNNLQLASMTPQPLPPGLSLLHEFITPDDERILLTFLARQEWRTDLRRRTIHYGGTYCKLPPRVAKGKIEAFFIKQETRTTTDAMSYECPKAATTRFQQEHITQSNTSEMTIDSAVVLNANGKRERTGNLSIDTVQRGQSTKQMKSTMPSPEIISADPIPPELDFLLQLFVHHNLYPANELPQFCIVNQYVGNQGISAHVENFRFAEPVVGLSLAGNCYIRFLELATEDDGSVRSRKSGLAEKTGKVVELWLPRTSLMVMRGESRRKWQHEIQHNRKGRIGMNWKRVSLTFRVEKKSRT